MNNCMGGRDSALNEESNIIHALRQQEAAKREELFNTAASILGVDVEHEDKRDYRNDVISELDRILSYASSHMSRTEAEEMYKDIGVMPRKCGKGVLVKVKQRPPYRCDYVTVRPGTYQIPFFIEDEDMVESVTSASVANITLTRIEAMSKLVDALPRIIDEVKKSSDFEAICISGDTDYAKGVLEALEAL